MTPRARAQRSCRSRTMPICVGGPVTVQGTYGALTVQADGSYTYVPNPAVAYFDTPQVESFNYQLVHPNGQVTQAALDVTVEPSGGRRCRLRRLPAHELRLRRRHHPAGRFPSRAGRVLLHRNPRPRRHRRAPTPEEATSVDALLDQFLDTKHTDTAPDSSPSVGPTPRHRPSWWRIRWAISHRCRSTISTCNIQRWSSAREPGVPEVLIGTTRPRCWPAILALLPCRASAACSHSGSAPTLAMAPPPAAQPVLVAQLDAPSTIMTAYAPASPGASLGLEEAVRRAVGWHPSIDEAMARLMQQAEAINIARSSAFPQRLGQPRPRHRRRHSQQQPQSPTEPPSATQTIFDFGQLSSSVATTTSGTNVSRAQVLLATNKVILDTAYAIIQVRHHEAPHETALFPLSSVPDLAVLVRQRTGHRPQCAPRHGRGRPAPQAAESTVLQVEADLARWKSQLASTGAPCPARRPTQRDALLTGTLRPSRSGPTSPR